MGCGVCDHVREFRSADLVAQPDLVVAPDPSAGACTHHGGDVNEVEIFHIFGSVEAQDPPAPCAADVPVVIGIHVTGVNIEGEDPEVGADLVSVFVPVGFRVQHEGGDGEDVLNCIRFPSGGEHGTGKDRHIAVPGAVDKGLCTAADKSGGRCGFHGVEFIHHHGLCCAAENGEERLFDPCGLHAADRFSELDPYPGFGKHFFQHHHFCQRVEVVIIPFGELMPPEKYRRKFLDFPVDLILQTAGQTVIVCGDRAAGPDAAQVVHVFPHHHIFSLSCGSDGSDSPGSTAAADQNIAVDFVHFRCQHLFLRQQHQRWEVCEGGFRLFCEAFPFLHPFRQQIGVIFKGERFPVGKGEKIAVFRGAVKGSDRQRDRGV